MVEQAVSGKLGAITAEQKELMRRARAGTIDPESPEIRREQREVFAAQSRHRAVRRERCPLPLISLHCTATGPVGWWCSGVRWERSR